MKKSDYYTSAQTYEEEDGMLRNFTMIDMDRKSTISTSVSDGCATKQHVEDRKNLIQSILDTPASLAPMEFLDFTKRGEGEDKIEWWEHMIRDEGLDFSKLLNLKTLLNNRKELYTKTY